jgi:formylglycine-generating enzyme required for sulfatase activity
MRLRWIPAGSFTMGSPASEGSRWDLETPHAVTLSRGFWMSDAPVTQSLWRAVRGDNPSGFLGDERPVERVSWEDCQRFLAALNARVPGLDARLPTEAQWERACRGGSDALNWIESIDRRRLGRVAWFHDNSGGETHPVRAKAPNPFGLYDMLGNVWEWCEDWYALYPESAETDPVGAASGALRIIRGGAFVTGRWYLRAAYRMGFAPANRDRDLGFRICCDVDA